MRHSSVRFALRLPASRLGGTSTRRGAGTDHQKAPNCAAVFGLRLFPNFASEAPAALLPARAARALALEGQSGPVGCLSEGPQSAPVGSSEGSYQKALCPYIRRPFRPASEQPASRQSEGPSEAPQDQNTPESEAPAGSPAIRRSEGKASLTSEA